MEIDPVPVRSGWMTFVVPDRREAWAPAHTEDGVLTTVTMVKMYR